MAKNRIDARNNQKLNLSLRKGHNSGTKKGGTRSRTAAQKKKEAHRIRQIGSRPVLEDLNDESTVMILGGNNVIYIHSNKIYAEMGLQTVNRIINRKLNVYINQVKNKLKSYANQLSTLENSFYNNNNIVKNLSELQQWWYNVIHYNPNADITNYIQALFSLQYAKWEQIVKIRSKDEYRQIMQNDLTTVINFLNKNKNNNSWVNNLLIQLINKGFFTIKNDVIEFDLNKLEKVEIADNLGKQYEYALTIAANEIAKNQINNEIKKIGRQKSNKTFIVAGAKEQIGNIDQGATDLILNGDIEVGVSAKLRLYHKVNIDGTEEIKQRFGAKATAQNLESFFNDKNSAIELTKEDLNVLHYGLLNLRNNRAMAGSAEFKQNMKLLMAWDRIIFAFLGDKYKTATLPPVFLSSFDNIIPMTDLITMIINMSNVDILSIINKNVGNWEKKSMLNKNKKEQLYMSKKNALAQNRGMGKNAEKVSYEWLKNKIIDALSMIHISTGNFVITYKILLDL